MVLNIYDSANGQTSIGDPDLELDIEIDGTVLGNYDAEVLSALLTDYDFTVLSGGEFGSLFENPVTGEWSFIANGTASIGDTVEIEVSAGLLEVDLGGNEVVVETDTDTITLTFTCFAKGTRIRTSEGPRLIEELSEGDLVQTRDAGLQPLRWIGSRHLAMPGAFAPIVFSPGAIGNDRELRVSPCHRMLLTGWRAQVMFGEPEVLVAARDLVNGDKIRPDRTCEVTYYHILFDTHQIVESEGVPSESYHPGETGLADLDQDTRAEVLQLFPELADNPATYGHACRPTLTAHQAKALVA
ncbi:Hint domain-containing protein [Halovulum sp. GXIMD14794]